MVNLALGLIINEVVNLVQVIIHHWIFVFHRPLRTQSDKVTLRRISIPLADTNSLIDIDTK